MRIFKCDAFIQFIYFWQIVQILTNHAKVGNRQDIVEIPPNISNMLPTDALNLARFAPCALLHPLQIRSSLQLS